MIANLFRIDIETSYSYSTAIGDHMPCSGVQISSNTFKNNIGCRTTNGILKATWFSQTEMTNLETAKTTYSDPSPMSKTKANNIQKTSVAAFSTENNVVLSSQTMDLNKFMLKDNTYENNFLGLQSGLVYLRNIRAIYMSNETYEDNSGHYSEALNSYGTITSTDSINEYTPPSGVAFSEYYLSNSGMSTISDDKVYQYYSSAPIIIDGALLVDIDTITFDNNYKPEYTATDSYTVALQSQTITFWRWNGKLSITSMTVQNLEGLDTTLLETVLLTDADHINQYTPLQRNRVTGEPTTSPTDPDYAIDYGIKKPILRFQTPNSDSDSNFACYFDSVSITGLSLSNITYYSPSSATPVFAEFPTSITVVTLTTVSITDVNMPLNSEALFKFKNKGTLSVSAVTVDGLEETSYSYDTSTFLYVADYPLFNLVSYGNDSSLSTVSYTIDDVTVSNLYGQTGSVVAMTEQSGVSNFHNIDVTLSNFNITAITSYTGGAIYLKAEGMDATLIDGHFESNYGVSGPADMKIEALRGLSINDTVFTKFTSDTTGSGLSIAFEADDGIPLLFNVTMYWDDTSTYSDTIYKTLIDDNSDTLISRPPVHINKGSVKTSSSTFGYCNVSKKGGIILVSSGAEYEDDSSTFTHNAANSGGAIYSEKGTITLSGTNFIENYATSGGAITLTSETTVESISDVTFTSNYASDHGGAMEILSSSTLKISSATFTENESPDSSAIYSLGTSGSLEINGTTFQDNIASTGRTVSLLFADAAFNDWTFQDNSATKETEGIFATFSEVEVITTNFLNSNTMYGEDDADDLAVPGGFIYISVGVTIEIKESTFTLGNAYSGGAIYMSGNSAITIKESNFTENFSYNNGGSIYLSNYDSLTATDWYFTNSQSNSLGSEIYSEAGTLSLDSCVFSVSHVTIPIYMTSTSFTGSGLTMSVYDTSNSEKTSEEGGMIASYESSSFDLSDSTFENINFAIKGGALYLESSTKTSIPSTPTHSISNVTFENNTAYHGGAIYIKEIDYVQISNVTMSENSAVSSDDYDGTGGALYYYSSSSYSKVDFSSSCTLSSNSASVAGGGIYWNYNQPDDIDNVVFTGNTATNYGDDYAWFAQKIIRIEESDYSDYQNSSRRALETLSGTDSITLTDQQSGGDLPTIYLALVDEFDQYVGSDSSSTATIKIESSTSGETYTPVLTGTTTQTASKGMFVFSSLTFTAEPGRTFSLSFSTTGIDSTKPSNSEYLSSIGSISTDLDFSVSLRECELGEAFLTTGACEEWEADVSYSLEEMSTPGDCIDCQDSMYCNGGSDVGPKPGYWRSSNTSDNFISCLYSSACLGYVAPDYNNLGECFEGYQGILCADCEAGYSRTGDYECSKCPDAVWNVIRLTLIMIAVLVALVFIIRSTLAGALQRKNLRSVYIKILMNHLQLIFLTASFDFDWPSEVLDIFETSEPAAQVSSQILSVDCFLDTRSDSEDTNSIRVFYQKMIIYALLPFLLAGSSICIWYIYYWFKNSEEAEKRPGRIIATVIILFFLVHPTIVQYMFSNFNCLEIDDEERIYEDLEVVCWTTEHINYSLMIAVPSIVVWGFGIPFFAWVILSRNKDQLDLIETREKYGFLYNGYKKSFYFWESVNMYRKITVIFISVFLKLAGVITQALVIFLVLILFLILNIKLLPFSFNSLNDMEMMSLITSMLTIYCGLFFLSDNPEVYESDDTTVLEADNGLRLSTGSKWFFFAVILTCNIMFVAFWCYKMLKEVESTIQVKFEKVYLFICLCGNKDRLEQIKLKRKIQDENELLHEEFESQLSKLSSLYKDGKLVFNRVTIEKSAAYLHPKNYLKHVQEKKKLDDAELRRIKRAKRMKETQNMMKSLRIDMDEDSKQSDIEPDVYSHAARDNIMYEESKGVFESDMEDFFEIPKQDQSVLNDDKNALKELRETFKNATKNTHLFTDSGMSLRDGIQNPMNSNDNMTRGGNADETNRFDNTKDSHFPLNQYLDLHGDSSMVDSLDDYGILKPNEAADFVKNMISKKSSKNLRPHNTVRSIQNLTADPLTKMKNNKTDASFELDSRSPQNFIKKDNFVKVSDELNSQRIRSSLADMYISSRLNTRQKTSQKQHIEELKEVEATLMKERKSKRKKEFNRNKANRIIGSMNNIENLKKHKHEGVDSLRPVERKRIQEERIRKEQEINLTVDFEDDELNSAQAKSATPLTNDGSGKASSDLKVSSKELHRNESEVVIEELQNDESFPEQAEF